MKARIKETGEVCDVLSVFLDKKNGRYGFFSLDEIEVIPDEPIKLTDEMVHNYVRNAFAKAHEEITNLRETKYIPYIGNITGMLGTVDDITPFVNTISDGHGNTWSKKCDVCGNDMQVVRPGSAICVNCNDEILANDGMR